MTTSTNPVVMNALISANGLSESYKQGVKDRFAKKMADAAKKRIKKYHPYGDDLFDFMSDYDFFLTYENKEPDNEDDMADAKDAVYYFFPDRIPRGLQKITPVEKVLDWARKHGFKR